METDANKRKRHKSCLMNKLFPAVRNSRYNKSCQIQVIHSHNVDFLIVSFGRKEFAKGQTRIKIVCLLNYPMSLL